MKKLNLLLCLLIPSIVYCQDFTGVIKTEYTYEDMSPEVKAQIAMFPTSTTIYVRENLSKAVTSTRMSEMIVLEDTETGDVIRLQSAMGNKIDIRSNVNDNQEEEEEDEDEFEFLDETKEILGYTCKKAYYEDENVEVTIYYTEELPQLPATTQMPDIKGYPMEMTVVTEAYTTIVAVTEVSKEKVKKIKMEVPAEYKEMTREEILEMQRGMQSGG